MTSYSLTFSAIDKTKISTVGGKAANLGELSRINGIHVPDGFCITTNAFTSPFLIGCRFWLTESKLGDIR
jgi:phosphoenolpyruvate synthase/pyruvate phosphate dikinase